MKTHLFTVIMLTVCAASFAQAAKLYKCVDENNHVTFSQSRCASNAKALNIQNREPTSEELQAAQARHQQNLRQISDIEREKQAEAQRVRARAQAAQAKADASRSVSDAKEVESRRQDSRNKSLEAMHKQANKSFRSGSMKRANDRAFKQFMSNAK